MGAESREATVQCMYRKIRTRVTPRSSEEALYQHFLMIIYMLVLQFFDHVFLMFPLLAYIIITNGFGIQLNKRVQLWAVFVACLIIINNIMSSMWLKQGNTFYSGESIVNAIKNQTTEQNLQVGGYMIVSLVFYIFFFRSGMSLGSISPVARIRQNTKSM